LPHLRTGHDVLAAGLCAPLVVGDAGVASLIQTRNLDERSRGATARAFDLELSALDVELSLALVALMETDVLEANEVLSGGNGLGDGELETVLVVAAPLGVDAGVGAAEAGLVDLEPVTRTVVAGHAALGSLGHVDEAGTRVLDTLVVEDLQGDLITGSDVEGLGAASLGSLVAAKVGGVHQLAGEGWVVGVAVAADVAVLATLSLAVDIEDVEDVVSINERSRQKGDESESLHDDGEGYSEKTE